MIHKGKNLLVISLQALLWLGMLIIPSVIHLMSNGNPAQALTVLGITLKHGLPPVLLYFINFYWFIPQFLFRKQVVGFIGVNFVVITLIAIYDWGFGDMNQVLWNEFRSVFWTITTVSFIFKLFIIACAIGLRYVVRWNTMQIQLKEEKQRTTEAELAWLKNQLNPHFLFNTLNNISSLVQINASSAQESIGQLSDLLRYTLYDSNDEQVPLDNEIEFMENYIDLMKLRCNDKTHVNIDFQKPAKPVMIVPLLFISLIENAFKHGVNSRKESFIHITLKPQGNDLVFICENSYYPKDTMDRSGSGIGLENLQRRLKLTYPNRYDYIQEVRGDTYFAQITLQNCL